MIIVICFITFLLFFLWTVGAFKKQEKNSVHFRRTKFETECGDLVVPWMHYWNYDLVYGRYKLCDQCYRGTIRRLTNTYPSMFDATMRS